MNAGSLYERTKMTRTARFARMLALMLASVMLSMMLNVQKADASSSFSNAHWDKTVARWNPYEYFYDYTDLEYHIRLWEVTDSGEVPIAKYAGTKESYINLGDKTYYDVRDFFKSSSNRSEYLGKTLRFKIDLYNKSSGKVVTYITSEDAVFCAVNKNDKIKPAYWDSEVAKVGSTMEMLTPPSGEHYFAGWSKDEAGRQMWDFRTDIVPGELTLYAQWLPVNVHVHDGATFVPWYYTDRLPESGTYYLLYDVHLSSDAVPKGDLELCLNGHSVTATGDTIRALNIKSGSSVTLYDDKGTGYLSGNTTMWNGFEGGTVLIEGGHLTLKGGEIRSGYAYHYGGNVYLTSGSFTMNGGSITNGTVVGCGAGVAVTGGYFTMNGGIIRDNTWNSPQNGCDYGGGVYVGKDGSFLMTGGTICNNTAICGGGVYAQDGRKFSISGGTITGNKGNTAPFYAGSCCGVGYRGSPYNIVAGVDGVNTGKIVIKDNTYHDSLLINETSSELRNPVINVEAKISSDSEIGVSACRNPKENKYIPAFIPITSGLSVHGYAGTKCPFFANNGNLAIVEKEGEAYLANQYIVTYSPGEHGSGDMSGKTARVIDGDTYTIENSGFRPDAHYAFDGWKDGDDIYKPGSKLKVEKDYSFNAQWKSTGDHKWDSGVITTEPTCTEKGIRTFTCRECGATQVADVDALGHEMTAHAAVEALCEEDGSQAYWTCSRDCCKGRIFTSADGSSEVQNEEALRINRIGHEWNLDSKETTGELVKETYRCSRCDASYVITANEDHVHGQGPIAFSEEIPPTCTEDGQKFYFVCACGERFQREEDDSKLWTRPMTDAEVVIPALGHEMTAHPAKEATCGEAGNSPYWSCDRCGRFFSDAAGENEIRRNSWVIAKSGEHSWDEGKITKKPSCTQSGMKTYTCTVCGSAKTESMEALGHDWKLKSETTGSEVTETYQCSRCKETYQVKKKKNHVHGEGVIAFSEEIAATCTRAGQKFYYVCECGAKFRSDEYSRLWDSPITDEEIIIPPLGHSLTEHPARVPTAREAGSRAYWSCERCGRFFSDAAGKNEITEDSWVIGPTENEVSGLIKVLPADPADADETAAKDVIDEYNKLTEEEKAQLDDEDNEKMVIYQHYLACEDAKAQVTKIRSVKAKKGRKVIIKWTKNTTVDGYQISYKAKGVKAKTVTVKKAGTVRMTVKKLKAGKVYNFKVRSFNWVYDPTTDKLEKIYGKWSSVKKCKVKK